MGRLLPGSCERACRRVIFAEDVVSAVSREECEELARLAEGKTVLEVGSYHGRSTVALASTAKKVHAVDWHLGDDHAGHDDTAAVFFENITRYGVRDRVAAHVCRLSEFVPLITGARFDGVFIDACHTKEAVLWDFINVSCLTDGWVAFHDYGRFGVTEVVDSLGKPQVVDSLAVLWG